jgi:hypothetical protein
MFAEADGGFCYFCYRDKEPVSNKYLKKNVRKEKLHKWIED